MKLLSLIVSILLTGCITQQRCLDKFPPKETNVTTNWISYVCDSFPFYLPANELTFDTSGIFPDNIVFHKTQKKGRLTQSISVSNGKVTFKCAEDSLKAIIEYQAKVLHENKRETITTIVPVRDAWYIFFRSGFWIILSLLLITIAQIIYSKKP